MLLDKHQPIDPAYQLMEHQQKAILQCNQREYFAYFMDPGLGKTLTVIHEVQSLPVTTIVVICPKSIMSVWAEEIIKFAPHNNVDVWDGNDFEPEWNGKPNSKYWFIINIDAVNPVEVKVKDADGNLIIVGTKKGKPVYQTKIFCKGFDATKRLVFKDNSMLVVDESTIIKNADAKRTKAVTKLGKFANYRRILTGTPIANTPLDVYAQFNFLSEDIFKYSKNYHAFRARYAVMGGYQLKQVIDYKNQEQLAAIIAQHSFRASKDEYLNLPPRTTQIRHVELSPATWKAYRMLVDELVVEIADSQMPIDMAVKKIVKLRQLTGGWLKDDDGNVHPVGHEKLSELKHLLDECNGQKVIIWCQFVHEVLELQKLHPKARVYYGAMNPKARDDARHAFESGDCPLIVIQNDTGSMGLTLNAATVSIFYSNPIYPLPKEQARERNHRKGQTKPVAEYELIVKGSIDETIYNALINKRSLADAIMENGGKKSLSQALMPKVNWKAPSKGR